MSSPPLSFGQFKLDIEGPSTSKQYSWSNHEVYVPFVHLEQAKEGEEVMLTLPHGGLFCHVDKACLKSTLPLLSSFVLDSPFDELVIKPASFGELFDAAYAYGVGLSIYSHNDCIPLARRSMEFFAEGESDGDGSWCFATNFSFEDGDRPALLPNGAVQQWERDYRSPMPHWRILLGERLIIYDDRIDWTNSLLPPLPDNARPISQLPDSVQASFLRRQRPLLPIARSIRRTASATTAATTVYHNPLLCEENTKRFRHLLSIVDQDIVPKAADITLTTTKAGPQYGDSKQGGAWKIQVSFISPKGFNVVFDAERIPPSLSQAHSALPNNLGSQSVYPPLRQRIVKHLAWMLFQYGRDFNLEPRKFDFGLQGLLPDYTRNCRRQFLPDNTDNRFPCLARFSCGKYQLPVMLLDIDKDNYICMPLTSKKLAQAEAPMEIPQLSELFIKGAGSLILAAQTDRLLLPSSLIDFPDHWYQGERISNKMVIDQFISHMKYKKLPENTDQPIKDKSGSPMLWLMGCVLIMALFIMWDFLL